MHAFRPLLSFMSRLLSKRQTLALHLAEQGLHAGHEDDGTASLKTSVFDRCFSDDGLWTGFAFSGHLAAVRTPR